MTSGPGIIDDIEKHIQSCEEFSSQLRDVPSRVQRAGSKTGVVSSRRQGRVKVTAIPKEGLEQLKSEATQELTQAEQLLERVQFMLADVSGGHQTRESGRFISSLQQGIQRLEKGVGELKQEVEQVGSHKRVLTRRQKEEGGVLEGKRPELQQGIQRLERGVGELKQKVEQVGTHKRVQTRRQKEEGGAPEGKKKAVESPESSIKEEERLSQEKTEPPPPKQRAPSTGVSAEGTSSREQPVPPQGLKVPVSQEKMEPPPPKQGAPSTGVSAGGTSSREQPAPPQGLKVPVEEARGVEQVEQRSSQKSADGGTGSFFTQQNVALAIGGIRILGAILTFISGEQPAVALGLNDFGQMIVAATAVVTETAVLYDIISKVKRNELTWRQAVGAAGGAMVPLFLYNLVGSSPGGALSELVKESAWFPLYNFANAFRKGEPLLGVLPTLGAAAGWFWAGRQLPEAKKPPQQS